MIIDRSRLPSQLNYVAKVAEWNDVRVKSPHANLMRKARGGGGTFSKTSETDFGVKSFRFTDIGC